jgi:hypothetical protein
MVRIVPCASGHTFHRHHAQGTIDVDRDVRRAGCVQSYNGVHFTAMVIAASPALGAFLWLERRKKNA